MPEEMLNDYIDSIDRVQQQRFAEVNADHDIETDYDDSDYE